MFQNTRILVLIVFFSILNNFVPFYFLKIVKKINYKNIVKNIWNKKVLPTCTVSIKKSAV